MPDVFCIGKHFVGSDKLDTENTLNGHRHSKHVCFLLKLYMFSIQYDSHRTSDKEQQATVTNMNITFNTTVMISPDFC